MNKLDIIQDEINTLSKKISNKYKDLKIEQGKTKIICANCKKKTKIGDLIFYQEHSYVSPYSCNGGDYWVSCDYDSYFICPKCEVYNKLLPKNILKLKCSFLEIKNVYDSKKVRWINYGE